MSYPLYISAEGAMAQQSRLENLANNLANVATPGFKRDMAVLQARYAEETASGEDYPGSHTQNDLGGGVKVSGIATDFSTGAMRRTETPTDMAIAGEGFFVVRRNDQRMLTRSGNFMMTNDGTLTTQEGYPVLTDADGTAKVDATAGPWSLTPGGAILHDGKVMNLALVKPHSMGDLVKVGDNLYMPLADPVNVPPENRKVLQGFLEQSGVKPPLEMIELIETSRAFEANVNMVKYHDQMLEMINDRVLKS